MFHLVSTRSDVQLPPSLLISGNNSSERTTVPLLPLAIPLRAQCRMGSSVSASRGKGTSSYLTFATSTSRGENASARKQRLNAPSTATATTVTIKSGLHVEKSRREQHGSQKSVNSNKLKARREQSDGNINSSYSTLTKSVRQVSTQTAEEPQIIKPLVLCSCTQTFDMDEDADLKKGNYALN